MNTLRSMWERTKVNSPQFVRRGVWKFRQWMDIYRFIRRLVQRQGYLDIQIGEEPWLDKESGDAFRVMIERSSYYLEYGGGGSTVLAARLNKPFVSVDTDRFFVKALRNKIGELNSNQVILFGNIGWTKQYGIPIFNKPNIRRRKTWKAYVELPWLNIQGGHLPEMVMIDGRFRVCAALTSLAHLMESPNSRVVVDDYTMRPFYHVIEKYAPLVCIVGRMAVFEPPSKCAQDIQEAIDQYSVDWR